MSTTYEIRGQVEMATSYDNATVGSGSVVNEVLCEYNEYGLLDREYQEHSGAKDGNTPYVGYNYDETATGGELENGLRTSSLRYPNGRLVHYTYGSTDSAADVLNRLDAINDDSSGSPGDVLASYTYLGLGTVVIQDYEEPDVKLDLFGGSSGTYAGFDQFDRIVDHRWYDYGSSADVDRFKYGYDRASNRIWKENVVAANNGKDFDEFYTYDGLHRLQNFDRGDLNAGKTGIVGTPANEEDWSLDALGNWSNFVQKTSGTTDLDQSRTVNEVNEITDITETTGPSWVTPAYDRNGNMATVPKPADPTVSFICTYDAWNRMVKVEESMTTAGEYSYDAFNRRVIKDVDSTLRDFLYSTHWQSLEERLDGSISPERQHVWGLEYVDQLVLSDRDTDANGTLDERVYALQDANWSISGLINIGGNVVARYRYEAYGHVVVLDRDFADLLPGAIDNPYTYTGRRLDGETGIYSFRARYYMSSLGIFLSQDPILYEGSVWNLYEFVGCDPLNQTDPSGLKVIAKPCGLFEWTWKEHDGHPGWILDFNSVNCKCAGRIKLVQVIDKSGYPACFDCKAIAEGGTKFPIDVQFPGYCDSGYGADPGHEQPKSKYPPLDKCIFDAPQIWWYSIVVCAVCEVEGKQGRTESLLSCVNFENTKDGFKTIEPTSPIKPLPNPGSTTIPGGQPNEDMWNCAIEIWKKEQKKRYKKKDGKSEVQEGR